MFASLSQFVREQYRTKDFIPLHAPVFGGHERDYVLETIESTFVSSVGAFVDRFERDMAAYTGSPRAIATVNGTAALQSLHRNSLGCVRWPDMGHARDGPSRPRWRRFGRRFSCGARRTAGADGHEQHTG